LAKNNGKIILKWNSCIKTTRVDVSQVGDALTAVVTQMDNTGQAAPAVNTSDLTSQGTLINITAGGQAVNVFVFIRHTPTGTAFVCGSCKEVTAGAA
jgi:hypothetical protein